MAGDLTTAHAPAEDAVAGDLSTPMQAATTPAWRNATQVGTASLFAAGALQIFDTAVHAYNRSVDALNQRWSDLVDSTASESGSGADAAALRGELQAEQRRAQRELNGSAGDVAGLLRAGPDSLRDPGVKNAIVTALTPLAQLDSGSGSAMPSGLRLLTLNIGGGAANSPGNEKGFDPGDVPALAQRILDGDIDVANLQEIFNNDAYALEEELERQSGDEWTIVFAPASLKLQFGGGTFPAGANSFGNAIAVRAPSDGMAGATGLSLVDSTTERLSDPSYFFWGPDGEGRSVGAVTVETPSGQRVTIGTAHTDYTGVSPEDQATQLQQLREHTEAFAAETGGDQTVMTGDFNHEIDEQNPSGATLRSWLDDYENAGGSIHGTHENGKTIDYVWTSEGLDYDDVSRLLGDRPDIPGNDANMSDHDGIAVDLNLPYSDSADDNDPPPKDDSDVPGPTPTPQPEPGPDGPTPEPSPEPGPSPTPSGG